MKLYTLKNYRTDYLKWGHQEAARKIGVSRQMLNQWENGTSNPSYLTQQKIVKTYGAVFINTPEGHFLISQKEATWQTMA